MKQNIFKIMIMLLCKFLSVSCKFTSSSLYSYLHVLSPYTHTQIYVVNMYVCAYIHIHDKDW